MGNWTCDVAAVSKKTHHPGGFWTFRFLRKIVLLCICIFSVPVPVENWPPAAPAESTNGLLLAVLTICVVFPFFCRIYLFIIPHFIITFLHDSTIERTISTTM